MDKIINYLKGPNLYISLALFAIGMILSELLVKYSVKLVKKTELDGRKAANIHVLVTVIKYIIYIFVIMTVLQIHGVNVTSLIAGLGIVSIVVGFALQDILKDLIMGCSLAFDSFFSIGVVIRYNDITGEVVYFNIKVTKLRDLDTGNIVTISNRNISEVQKISDWFLMSVPGNYEVDVQKMREICKEICRESEKAESVEKCTFLGTGAFLDSSINYTLKVNAEPKDRYDAKRVVNGTIQDVYKRHHISVPYPQMDVHFDRPDE